MKYNVRFEDENGNEIETNQYAYGETPVCSATPTKANTAEYTYGFAWTPQIQTVQGAATYRAVFTPTTNKYTVTVKSNPSGACTSSGAGLYDYNTSATLTLSVNDGYTFTGWSDGQEGMNTTRTITVTEDKELVANFTVAEPDWTITWKSEDGQTTLAEVGQKANTATIFTGAIPTKDATAAKTCTFYGWSTQVGTEENEWNYGTIYKNGMTPKATANATYYAYFNETDRTYTITWANEAGTANIEVDYEQPYGAAIAYNSATPTKAATADYTYTFDGWSTTVGGDVEALPATVSGDAIFYAHFISTPIVSGYNLEIGVNDKETLTETTTKDNLIITSNGVSSGQLINANNLTLNGDAIFRLQQSFAAGTWYAVAVPWTVDPATGIYGASGRLASGSQMYIIEFDGDAYAEMGGTEDHSYWKFLHQTGADMVPGKLYMIYLSSAHSQLDFHKKDGEALLTTSLTVSTASGSAGSSFANWNAIANPALFHADLSTGVTKYQTYDNNDAQTYTVVDSETENLIVAKPVFIQTETPGTVYATVSSSPSSSPYRRVQQTTNESKFVVEIACNDKMADRLIVETTDEKEDKYVIGQDLAKFGVSSKVAQMWVNRYDAKLCANTVTPFNGVAEYPLSVFAPAAGEYTLSAMQKRGDAELYLTYNGQAIWNLSESAYTLNLNKGMVSNYGLRVSAHAPQNPTGVDEAIVDAQGETRKVLINNQVFIIRGDKVYSVDGRLVK